MLLADGVSLVYVLAESGCRGQLTSGRIERDPSGRLDVFDARGKWFQYISGERLRSWCVLGPDGKPIDGWLQIRQEDLSKILVE
jgi:hypothetical protein